ncbi:hypothetical protein [Streptomyces sp. NPDC052107]|uniref:hypothetical protein n=1 Tax=Streptomyces sp. NPDC052107 TaxID=3155632 RepID=UPI0034388B59
MPFRPQLLPLRLPRAVGDARSAQLCRVVAPVPAGEFVETGTIIAKCALRTASPATSTASGASSRLASASSITVRTANRMVRSRCSAASRRTKAGARTCSTSSTTYVTAVAATKPHRDGSRAKTGAEQEHEEQVGRLAHTQDSAQPTDRHGQGSSSGTRPRSGRTPLFTGST